MVRRETKTLQGSTDDDQDYDGKTWYDDDDDENYMIHNKRSIIMAFMFL